MIAVGNPAVAMMQLRTIDSNGEPGVVTAAVTGIVRATFDNGAGKPFVVLETDNGGLCIVEAEDVDELSKGWYS